MTKRRILLLALVGMATVACAAIALAIVFRDPINERSCRRIQEGMTEAEVTEILGRPSDEFQPLYEACLKELVAENEWRVVIQLRSTRRWKGPSGKITVHFDASGGVNDYWFEENENSMWRKVCQILWMEEKTESPPYLMFNKLDTLEPE